MNFRRWLRWRSDRELEEEIQAHVEAETQDNLDRGMSAEEARYAAMRKIGNTTRLRERAREGDPLAWCENVAKDVRYALRSLRRNPGFTFAAVLSLALGVGANSAVFSFADGFLLRPLDVPHPSDLVRIQATTPQGIDLLSYTEFAAFRDQNRTLSGMFAERPQFFSEQDDENQQARYVFGETVSGNFLQVVGVRPMLGRDFLPEEDSPAAKDIAALLSYEGWQAKFHGDPKVVGARIRLNGQSAIVIGVLPAWFPGTQKLTRPEIYVTLAAMGKLFPLTPPLADPANRPLQLLGRLKSGVNIAAAQAEFAALSKRVQQAFPVGDRWRSASVLPEVTTRVREDGGQNLRLIELLMGIAGVVLLIASFNVANLLLGRASARVKEIGIRQSVGAGRARLVCQLLTESLVLAMLGGGVGLLLAAWAVAFMNAIQLPFEFPFSTGVRVDSRVLMYSLGVMLVSVLVFGLWPAFRATRVDLTSSVKVGWRAGRRVSARTVLVAIQTALAVMLLIPASLFAKSFMLARSASPGFRVENLVTMAMSPPLGGDSLEQTKWFYAEIERRIGKLPGVASAALATHLVMGGDTNWNLVAPEDREAMGVMYNQVTPEYFRTMDVPIVQGRAFEEHDSANSPLVAIVSQALARKFWPKGDALGQRIRFGDGEKARVLEIVGIAGDAKYQESLDQMEPYLYIAYAQHSTPQAITLLVHTQGDAAAMIPVIRHEVTELSASVPVYEVHSMRELFQSYGLLTARLIAQMGGAMGGIGLVLGIVGLYAVVAFSVSRRIREIGIRMVLGATSSAVLRQVLGSGARVAAVGIAAGLAGAWLITRYLGEFLDRVNPHDPWAFAGVAGMMLAVTLAACWSPARRASRVDPAVTLRDE